MEPEHEISQLAFFGPVGVLDRPIGANPPKLHRFWPAGDGFEPALGRRAGGRGAGSNPPQPAPGVSYSRRHTPRR